jgi:hypothetical protein
VSLARGLSFNNTELLEVFLRTSNCVEYVMSIVLFSADFILAGITEFGGNVHRVHCIVDVAPGP